MTHLLRYLAGMLATFVGAAVTELTDSMLPLALGASMAVMCTAPLVKHLWIRRRG